MGEHDGALANRVDIAGELEVGKVFEEALVEQRTAARSLKTREIHDVFRGKAERLDHLGKLIHAARHRVTALERVLAEIHVETRLLIGLARVPIALRHGQLVQIGHQSVVDVHRPSPPWGFRAWSWLCGL